MQARVLLLPGFACTADIWQPVLSLLAPEIDAAAVDWPAENLKSYESVDDLAAWLLKTQPCADFDLLVGHSMGGLVMLSAAAKMPNATPVGLVESFLLSPVPLFQNLLMPDAAPDLVKRVQAMMAVERMRFSARLAPALRQLDLSGTSLRPGMRVRALYGDRGCGDPEKVRAALRWPDTLRDRIPATVAEHACHFPMLENPAATARAIRAWVEEFAV